MTGCKVGAALFLLATSNVAVGSDLEQAQKIQSRTHAAAAKSQTVISASAEQSRLLQAEIELLQEEVRNLELYQRHLDAMIANQEREKSSFAEQIKEIQVTRQGIVPLMYDMLDALRSQVEQDLPIKTLQRQDRVSKLENLMVRADVADAEKFRRILEAYQIEMDYGSKLSAYQAPILLSNGKQIEVEQLHLGRISLIARNLSGDKFWYWQSSAQAWQELSNVPASEINQAFDVASQKVAPSLILLPLSVARVEGK
ncbi:TPA: DUF3450 family protein [Vibrio vulnificus]|uniref:DUF3450 domain-containing protein n=1 Tax=Vibrio sp. 05-20-BW147 TaxID=2575834 RepID=UPI001594CD8E|nr:DUF3450 domain-containing protein [Vibrio sp. 05-20-BW147]NVC64296.1 DUF3450 domain-containing protein [Vibrio sp. 05-20-BW147]HAS6346991.1 DUF3450 family protein [Vibrio vulnificus]